MPHTARTYFDSQICDTLWKKARKVRQKKRGPGHYPVAHPTKKVTRGRIKTSQGGLFPGHRKLSIKELIRKYW